jgi:hypothetical protein
MKRFKSLYKEAKVEVDDISVGVKKKKPAGVKADEPLKGYAYNEKRVTDIDVEQSERELKKAKLDKAKEKVQKEEQEEKHYLIRVVGKGGPGKDYMNVKTRATSQKAALEKIRKQYPGNSYSVVKEDYDTSISLSIEEIEMNEALSPKEKEKRLLMIKKAVQKLNRANIEKAKKMAMRDMKASGMFDDAINEHIKGGADSYYALQQAKEKAKKMGKVWSKMGEPEKEKLIDVEMKAVGYEKKPGNTMYTKIPTEREKAYADKVRAKDKEVSKMSEPDKVDYFSKNPTASSGGHNISDEGKKKIQIARYQSQIDALEKKAIEAQRKAYEAEEKGDDLAFEKYQDEEEYFLERIREVETHLQNLKDE